MTRAERRAALEEIERKLRRAAKGVEPAKALLRRRSLKPVLPFLGLTVPQQRAVYETGFRFSGDPPERQYPIWDTVWREARTHEAKMQAVFFLRSFKNTRDSASLWTLVRGWADHINAWDHSDELSKTYAYLLRVLPREVYPALVDWNRAGDAWKRRQSVVSLFCYAGLHAEHPPVGKVLPLVERLLRDPDDYVQKGVGWTLRETYNVYPDNALAFVLRHAGEIHPDAFSAALEKMSAAEKKRVKAKRATQRPARRRKG